METREGSLEVAAEFGVREAAEGSAMVRESREPVEEAVVGGEVGGEVSSD